jgi:thioesterase domain-containing protein
MRPALVLLPGMDGTGDMFGPLVGAMAGSVRTIVVRYRLKMTSGLQPLDDTSAALVADLRPHKFQPLSAPPSALEW